MEHKLTFTVTKTDGTTVKQELAVPPEEVEISIQRMLVQYATVGMLKKDGDTYRLLSASQIAEASVELPSVLLATVHEMPQPQKESSITLE